MSNRRYLLGFMVLVLFIFITPVYLYAEEAVFKITGQEIIERLIRLEEGQKSLQRQIDGLDKRIDGLDKRIDGLENRISDLASQIEGLRNMMMGGFGILISGMIALVGFVLWDRRTALAPAIREIEDLRRRERELEEVLRKYAALEPRLVEIMKSLGLW